MTTDLLAETFEVVEDRGVGLVGDGALDERERRLVIGAANYHALVRRGATLRLTVVRALHQGYPSLTDERCLHIGWTQDRESVGSVVVRSLVAPEPGTQAPGGFLDLVVDVGGKPVVQNSYQQLSGPVGRAKKLLRSRVPFQYDHLRQLRTDVIDRRMRSVQLPQRRPVAGNANYHRAATTARPAIIFGLHWLELGGAERWALDCIEIAKEAGFVPIVTTDRESAHPWITRPEFDDVVFIPVTHPIRLGNDAALFSGLFTAFDIRGIHVHHNTWLYDRLSWVKSVWPDVPVVDSQHVLEWRTGGFVDHAVQVSAMIDQHHVISPQLRDYLVHRQGIAADKVVLATLANATTAGITPDAPEAEAKSTPFTVTYIGRFHQQKRPQVFLKLAAELKKSSPVPVRFIVQGDGELADEVHTLRGRLGLTDVLEVRAADHPVKDTLAESDVLVVTSENEGLTLTTFEATAAGVPVLSADVGSQASVVPDGLLCPRHPYAFVRQAAEKVRTMMTSPEQRKRWFEEQAAKNEAFAKLPKASAWATELYQGWKKQ
ncbi:glycosyltransferase family 4 protein [Amycolatopsis sp. NPDC051716]|uniref:glycosyltransferase family 4 protein n=1 Tax=Amycolatopsis sp. NPDC051716 TaxID=3155804 RepID=UPI003427A597